MKLYLQLMLFMPLLRLMMLLDVSRKLDGSEPYETEDEPIDTTFIDLIDQVRFAISYNEIPCDPSTPRRIMVTIPMKFRNGAVSFTRRTIGHWASFTVEGEDKWKAGYTATYYISLDREFAMSLTGPDGRQGHLEPLSVLEVLREEKLWRAGLTSLLEKTNSV